MWHLLIWIPLALLLGAWSLLAWGLHALISGPSWVAADPEGWLRWLEQWQIPVWLALWLPMDTITALKAALTAAGPWLEDLLRQAPSLAGWLSPVVWFGWLVGAAVLLFLGVLGSVLVAALRPAKRPPAAPA